MGYTHYWIQRKPMDDDAFKAAVVDCGKILDRLKGKIPLTSDTTDTGAPVLSDSLIEFNGVGEDGHETFAFKLPLGSFSFCKTAQKPYDLAVTGCLVVLKHHLGDSIEVSSDGDEEDDWDTGKALVQHTLGYGLNETVLGVDP